MGLGQIGLIGFQDQQMGIPGDGAEDALCDAGGGVAHFFSKQTHQVAENIRQCPEAARTIPISDSVGRANDRSFSIRDCGAQPETGG
jgi:hypothetical protein